MPGEGPGSLAFEEVGPDDEAADSSA